MIRTIHILSILVAASACQSTQGARSSNDELYSEDLSRVRPEYVMPEDTLTTETTTNQEVPDTKPSNDVTSKVNTVLDKSDEIRQSVNAVDGFTIQVYSGTNSEDARKIRGKILSVLPEEYTRLYYDEPNFKVKVGRYFTRLEAQKNFNTVREEFPTAIIIPERIPIDADESEE